MSFKIGSDWEYPIHIHTWGEDIDLTGKELQLTITDDDDVKYQDTLSEPFLDASKGLAVFEIHRAITKLFEPKEYEVEIKIIDKKTDKEKAYDLPNLKVSKSKW